MSTTVFRVSTAPTAPRIQFVDEELGRAIQQAALAGSSLRSFFSRHPVSVVGEGPVIPGRFYQLCPNMLVIDDGTFTKNEDLYYSLVAEVELLELSLDGTLLRAIYPEATIMPALASDAPCVLKWKQPPLFRIEGHNPLEIYCATGVDVPLNEFKNIYDHHGLERLLFHPIWTGRVVLQK